MVRAVPRFFLFFLLLFSVSAQALEINFGELGNGSAAVLDAGFGVSVSGSANVNYADMFSNSTNGGLGIGDFGVAANSLDAGEVMTFDFGQVVDSVLLTVHDIPPFGNVFYNISAMLGAVNLGVFAVPLHTQTVELIDISALVGSTLDTFSVAVTASAPLGLVIEGLQYEPQNSAAVSSPGVLWLLVLPAWLLARRRPLSR